MQPEPSNRFAIIGAGIVGLCIAHALRQAGCDVTVIDAETPASQCSFGNAGALSAGSVAPLAMPGVLRDAPGMLLDADGPLHIPARYWLAAAPWLIRFVRASQPKRVEAIASALQMLLTHAIENHQRLAREIGCPECIVRNGQLHLYPNEAALAKDSAGWRLREAHGLRMERVDAQAIHELEPAVAENYRTGYLLPDQAWVTEPFRYACAIAAALRAQDVRFVQARVRRLQRAGAQWQLQCDGQTLDAEQVIVAAGAWSAQLLEPLGWRVPLESQRGYHLQMIDPGVSISRVVVLADRKIFMTPMESGLRVAGTVEFGGLRRAPNMRRAYLLGRHAAQGLAGLNAQGPDMPGVSVWMGHRPCMPDSLPVLGPVPDLPGLWCAFGHGHLGLTGAANTGHLIAGALRGEVPLGAFSPFSIARFR